MAAFSDPIDVALGMEEVIKMDTIDGEGVKVDAALIQNLLARILVLETQVADLTAWKGQVEARGRSVNRRSRNSKITKEWEPPDSYHFDHSEEFQSDDFDIIGCKVCPGVEFDSLQYLADHYTSVHTTDSILKLPENQTNSSSAFKPIPRPRRFTEGKPKALISKPSEGTKRTKRRKPSSAQSSGGGAAEGFPCPDGCGRHFAKRDYANRHLIACRGLRPYQCDICHKSFLTRSGARRRKSEVHFNGNRVMCSICGISLNQTSLEGHMLLHAGVERRRHKCTFCDSKFRNRHDLIIHQQSRHSTGEALALICELCGKSFKGKATLRIHMLTHTGTICKGCGARFRNSDQLWRHRRKNAGGRCQVPPRVPNPPTASQDQVK